ncbi:MAG: ABC transporter permease [Bacteroidales bacterium]|nr:ABC transporter permease [Candidatus Cryptobacteroides fimicaballi]
MRDILLEIWESVRKNKLRTCLTGFAVSWGILMLVILLGAGNGVMNSTMGNMEDIASNIMEIYPGRTSKPYGGLKEGRWLRLTEKDASFIEGNAFSDVIDRVSASKSLDGDNYKLTYGKTKVTVYVRGVGSDYSNINKVEIYAGRFLNKNDEDQLRKVVIVPSNIADRMLDGKGSYESLIGRRVKVGSFSFKIIGIRKPYENQDDRQLLIPISTLMRLTPGNIYLSSIDVSFHGLKTEEQNREFETKLKRALNERHMAAPDDESAFWIWNRFTMAMQMEKGRSILEIALWIIGIFTLMSGIVGVSNIMLITVKERTHEFGIRKAIGASPRDIIRLIISESVAITAVFGYVGMVLGLVVCEIMDKTVGASSMEIFDSSIKIMENPTVSVGTAVGVTAVLIVAGTLAGLIPARKAAKVRPIESLRAD